MKTVLITGATSGIGQAAARAFAAEGFKIIITGRRAERLKELKAELEENGAEVALLSFDVRDRVACKAAMDSLPKAFQNIDILVNNAGLAAGLEHLDKGDPMDWDAMIDTNIKGVLHMTQLVARSMIERGAAGHIVNLGSIAGTQPYENGNVYSATKHAMHALSQGMRMDFLTAGIRVTEIRPGMVETEFSVVRFHGNHEKADGVYKGIEPLSGDDVAEAILWATTLPAHMNIDEIVLTPLAQANAYYTHRK